MQNKTIIGLVIAVLVVGGIWYFASNKQEVKLETTKIKIAYLASSAQALPLYLSIDKGYFNDAGLEVEPVKFEAPNQIIDALIAGNVDFGSPSTAMGITAISQAKNPNTLKIFALNGGTAPNNIDNVLLVKKDSTISTIQDLKGKKLGTLPGIQFRTIAQHILSTENLTVDKDVTIFELAIPLQLQALITGQIDAVLTLEPVKVIGKSQNAVKDLVIAPMDQYIADPWYGGGGVVSVKFSENNPNTTKKVIAVFDKAINEINANPDLARQYLKNYTPLNDQQIKDMPLPIWKTYTDFKESDISALQKFFDIFAQYKVIENKVDARQLLYSN
jgi:NitT/TauT family transport system substrate-binding protein